MKGDRWWSSFILLLVYFSISTSNGAPLNTTDTVLPSMGEPCHHTNICADDLICSSTKDDAICIPPETNDKCSAHWECEGMHVKCRDGICRSAEPGDMCGGNGLTCNPDMTCNEHICNVNYAGSTCKEDRECTGALVCSEASGTCTNRPMGFVAKVLVFLAILSLGATYAAVYNHIEDDYITVKPVNEPREDENIQDSSQKILNDTEKPSPDSTGRWPFRKRPNSEDDTSNGNRDNNNNIIGRMFQRNSGYQSTGSQQNAGRANHQ